MTSVQGESFKPQVQNNQVEDKSTQNAENVSKNVIATAKKVDGILPDFELDQLPPSTVVITEQQLANIKGVQQQVLTRLPPDKFNDSEDHLTELHGLSKKATEILSKSDFTAQDLQQLKRIREDLNETGLDTNNIHKAFVGPVRNFKLILSQMIRSIEGKLPDSLPTTSNPKDSFSSMSEEDFSNFLEASQKAELEEEEAEAIPNETPPIEEHMEHPTTEEQPQQTYSSLTSRTVEPTFSNLNAPSSPERGAINQAKQSFKPYEGSNSSLRTLSDQIQEILHNTADEDLISKLKTADQTLIYAETEGFSEYQIKNEYSILLSTMLTLLGSSYENPTIPELGKTTTRNASQINRPHFENAKNRLQEYLDKYEAQGFTSPALNDIKKLFDKIDAGKIVSSSEVLELKEDVISSLSQSMINDLFSSDIIKEISSPLQSPNLESTETTRKVNHRPNFENAKIALQKYKDSNAPAFNEIREIFRRVDTGDKILYSEIPKLKQKLIREGSIPNHIINEFLSSDIIKEISPPLTQQAKPIRDPNPLPPTQSVPSQKPKDHFIKNNLTEAIDVLNKRIGYFQDSQSPATLEVVKDLQTLARILKELKRGDSVNIDTLKSLKLSLESKIAFIYENPEKISDEIQLRDTTRPISELHVLSIITEEPSVTENSSPPPPVIESKPAPNSPKISNVATRIFKMFSSGVGNFLKHRSSRINFENK